MPSATLPFCLTLALAVLLACTTQGLATSTKGENSIAINNEQEAEAGQSGAQPMGKMTESSGAAPIEGNVTTMEYSALVDLYSSTNGNGWINNSNWLNPYLSPCNWYGIICDATFRHVLLLDLSSNKLSGSVPNSLSGLFNLQVLRLQNNAIGGVLPDSLSQLKSLDVANFSVNSFVGPLPDSYGVLTNYSLLYLGAAFNSLSGSIPQWVQSAKGIVTIDLRGNPFFCPIPSWASYTGASCFNVNITNIEPSCPQPNGLVLVFGGPFPSSLNNIFCQWTSLWFGTVWYSPAEAVNQQTVACGYGLIQPGTPVSLQLTQYNQPVTSQPFYPSLDCYPNSTTNRRIRRLQPSSDSSLLTAPASLLLLSLLSLALFFI